MKFYLNNVQVKVEVAPTITETEDETLDSASVILEANSQRLPYAPMQQFRVDFENGQDVLYFYVVSDSVEIFSLNPERYRHTLSLVQNTRKLSKHLVRNSSFSQPAYKYLKSYWAVNSFYQNGYVAQNGCGESYYSQNPSSREKITDTYIYIELLCGFQNIDNDDVYDMELINSISELNTRLSTNAFSQAPIVIHYTLNDVAQTYTLTNADVEGGISFNKKLRCPKIKELYELGATNLYIKANNGVVVLSQNVSGKPYFTNTRITTYTETYYYSAYDILELLRKRQRQTTDTYQRTPLFALPTSVSNPDLYNLLKNTISPNFTFTQCTMYECVAEVFRLFDAIFTLDSNNVLGIEYFNDNDTTTTIESQNKFAGLNISISEDRYTNRLVAYYQDARQERTFPSKNSYCLPRSTTLGVPEANDHALIVDKPIYHVEKLEMIINTIGYGYSAIDHIMNLNMPIDITDYIQEDSIYSLLPTTLATTIDNFLDGSSFIQASSLHYTRGSTVIPFGEETKSGIKNYPNLTTLMYFVARRFMGMDSKYLFSLDYFKVNGLSQDDTPDWKTLQFRITYTTTIDGRTVVETLNNKSDGETLINQNNGAVDLNKMGLNMLGVSLKTGEPQLSGTMQITSWANRLKKGTKYLDKNNNLWVLNVANYTLYDNCINCSVSFVKNYNELSRRIRINDVKRLSNISAELTQKSEDNIVDFVYYSATQDFNNYQTYTYINYIAGFHAFKNTFGVDDTDQEVQYANVKTYDNDNLINTTYCPLVKYAFGNSLCFEISFDSPISAGNSTKAQQSGWFGNNKYNTTAVKYANDSGFVDKIDIKYINTPEAQSFTQDFPQIPALSNYNIRQLEIWKQPNEVFALNYELAFLPTRQNRDFIGQAFLQNNNFIISKDDCKKKFYLYYANDTFQYSVLDIKAHGERKEVAINLITSLMKQQIIVSIIPQSSTTASNWALADEDGNIYFASNYSMSDTTYNIYFQFRKERI